MAVKDRVGKLETFFRAKTMSWADALRFVDALLLAISQTCDPATTATLTAEIHRIVAEHERLFFGSPAQPEE
jgi:hypothetical protein